MIQLQDLVTTVHSHLYNVTTEKIGMFTLNRYLIDSVFDNTGRFSTAV